MLDIRFGYPDGVRSRARHDKGWRDRKTLVIHLHTAEFDAFPIQFDGHAHKYMPECSRDGCHRVDSSAAITGSKGGTHESDQTGFRCSGQLMNTKVKAPAPNALL
jgi:hypothetical protein